MINVGSRSDPSIIKLVTTVVLVVVIIIYVIISLSTGDWLWWNPKFSETPHAMMVQCYGDTITIDPGSYHFGALTKIVDQDLSGRKRWDQLSLSEVTYHDYQTDASMMVLELSFGEPIRIHSNYKFFSNVDQLVIPLDGRHAQTNAIFGLNQGIPTAGSMHVESIASISSYLKNQGICPTSVSRK